MLDSFNQPLIQAAEGGDLPTVQTLLSLGADPNAMGPNSGALHTAAFGGHLDVVKALLVAGANPNLADPKGLFPLQLAASKGRLPVMKALILAKADLEAKTLHGGTALHVASASDFPDAVSMLLEVGADLEARDAGGNTPIATACSLGRIRIYEILKKAGANLGTRSAAQETLPIKAARGLRTHRVRKWVSSDLVNSQQLGIENGFFFRIIDGQKEGIPIAEQRNLVVQDKSLKIHAEYLDACELLIQLLNDGLRFDYDDQEGHTAFSLVCHAGESLLMVPLLQAGAKTTIDHDNGFSPIHLVAGSGRLDGLIAFLDLVPDADLGARDEFGWTALHWLADVGGDLEMARLLIAKGADVSAKSTEARGALPIGITPTDVAIHWRDTQMADALKIN